MTRVYTIHVELENAKNKYYEMEVLGETAVEAVANTMQYFSTRGALIPCITSVYILRHKIWNDHGVLKLTLKTASE